jgi:hypothetical protein
VSGPVFKFCVPVLFFGGTEGIRSHFHVLHARNHFQRYSRRSLPFSCFALPDTFLAVRRASGPVFMFCARRLIFDGSEGVGFRFKVMRPRSRCHWYRERRVPFSFIALADTFSVVLRASSPDFKFFALGNVLGVAEGVVSRFHVLRPRSHFWRYRWRRVPFSCFALPDMFSRGAEGVVSRFHVLHSRTHFRRFRGSRVPFSSSTLPDTFSAISRASDPVFIFYAPIRIFGDTGGVQSRFHVLHSRTRFRRCGGRQVSFSCFALPDSFSAVPRASGPVFMFCVHVLVFGCTDGVGSPFHVLRCRTRFRRCGGRRVPFLCSTLPNSFSVVSTASSLIFMFCAPGLIFSGSEDVGSRFHVLCPCIRFQRFRGRQVSF